MFGFGIGELLLVGGVILFALLTGRSLANTARQAGQMTGLWLKLKKKLSLLRFLR